MYKQIYSIIEDFVKEEERENALIVSMSEMVQIDESINELYNLPLGWIAYRENKTTEWIRSLN